MPKIKICFTDSSLVLKTDIQEIEIRYADLIKAFMAVPDSLRYEVGQYLKGYFKVGVKHE